MNSMTEYLVVRSRTTLVLVAGALAAWAVTIDRMRGMTTARAPTWADSASTWASG